MKALKAAVAALVLAAANSDAAKPQAPVPEVPAEVLAMLKEHRGVWRTEGEWIADGKSQPTKATWECNAAVDGVGNVCIWRHQWADRPADAALEIMGYDPNLKTLSITRVTDLGVVHTATPTVRGNTMVYRWQSAKDGKTSIGSNEIVVKSSGEWVQHMTIEVDGKSVTEMNVTHHRVSETIREH